MKLEFSHDCWDIAELYEQDPFTHVYLVYDVIYERARTSLYTKKSGGKITGYLLVWHGLRRVSVHVWGDAEELIRSIDLGRLCFRGCVIQLYSSSLLDHVLNVLEDVNNVAVSWYLDMVVNEDSFKPYRGVSTVRLDPKSLEHANALVELKALQGVQLSPSEAASLIRKMRYHGVFEGKRLASIAGTYLRTRDIWVLGDVFTRPESRGRGYAKAVTSSVTLDVLNAGAMALLHVEEDNIPARRVYESLGYRAIGRRPWIFVEPTHRS